MAKTLLQLAIFDPFLGQREPQVACFGQTPRGGVNNQLFAATVGGTTMCATRFTCLLWAWHGLFPCGPMDRDWYSGGGGGFVGARSGILELDLLRCLPIST